MPEAPVLGTSRKVTLDDAVFGAAFNGPLVHESVRAELNAKRRGTASTKTRGKVRGGGAKPWRQKGTGRARAGSSRSPIWTGGGTIFGPSPRHYTFKINRKEKRAALRSILSVHAERASLAIFETGAFDTPSTKGAAKLIADWVGAEKAGKSVLVVLGENEALTARSFRNLPRVSVLSAANAGVADLVGAHSLLATEAAIDAFTARAKGASVAATTESSEEA
jgi:large subunit ribosomal protein L4